MKEALTLALEALEAIYTVGDVACVVKPEGEIYLKPVIDKCKAALAQQQQSWVSLTKEEIDSALCKYASWYNFAAHLENILKEKNQ